MTVSASSGRRGARGGVSMSMVLCIALIGICLRYTLVYGGGHDSGSLQVVDEARASAERGKKEVKKPDSKFPMLELVVVHHVKPALDKYLPEDPVTRLMIVGGVLASFVLLQMYCLISAVAKDNDRRDKQREKEKPNKASVVPTTTPQPGATEHVSLAALRCPLCILIVP